MSARVELSVTRDGNAVIGNFYRVTAWLGNEYLGERIYSGYSKRQSLQLARAYVKERGRFN